MEASIFRLYKYQPTKNLQYPMKSKLFIIVCLFFSATLFSQNSKIIKDTIWSEVLGEKRALQILLPKQYDADSEDGYAVIYLLDGPWNQEFVGPIRDFIRVEKHMPPSIVISIVNVDRNRDFLPSHHENVPSSGKADNFLKFLGKELKPWVDKNYPAKRENIIMGHSFGGVLVTYALLMEPDLFDAYLAGDPSFWWDDGYMVEVAAEKLPSLAGKGKILHITGRKDGDAYSGMGIDKMDSVLNLYKPDDLYWESIAYPNETHGTSRLKSAYDGLRYVYEGYGQNNVAFHPQNGIFHKDHPITVINATGYPNVRYTTDGSAPTPESPKLEQRIELTEPCILKAKAFSPRGNNDSGTLTGSFLEEDTPDPVKKVKGLESGGVNYSVYKGEWEVLPDFGKLKADLTGITDKKFTLDTIPYKEDYGILFEGFLKIEEEGNYVFVLSSDDGSKLYLGDKLLLDNDGLHAADETKTFNIPLKKGYYPVRLEFFQGRGGQALNFSYVKPGSNRPEPVPQEFLFHQ